MAISLKTSFDSLGVGSAKTVASGDAFFGLDGSDSLFSSSAITTFKDGGYWAIPSGLSGGKGDDKYYVGYEDFAVIADAGFGSDYLRVYRSLSQVVWSARIEGRRLAAIFEAFPSSSYRTVILIVDAYKPEGSVELVEFDNNTILDASFDKLPALVASSGIPFEDLTWDEAIAKKYLNLSVLGVTNSSSGAAELMDLIYKIGNPVVQPGVHRFFDPSKGVSLYTDDLDEVNNIRSRLGNYQYEGKVYDAGSGKTGGLGDDTLKGLGRYGFLDGGPGFDTAWFSVAPGELTIRTTNQAGTYTITSMLGTDTITGIEQILTREGGFLIGGDSASGLFRMNRGGENILLLGTIYQGPVATLQRQLLGTIANEIIGGTTSSDFINLLGGDDAADAGLGDDVLDGGIGSNFLTGGGGKDVFFVDGRGGATTWSTITDWGPSEQLSVWGWKPGVSKASWVQSAGANGFQGVTMHGDLNGDGLIDTSVTWTGQSQSILPTPREFDGLLWFL